MILSLREPLEPLDTHCHLFPNRVLFLTRKGGKICPNLEENLSLPWLVVKTFLQDLAFPFLHCLNIVSFYLFIFNSPYLIYSAILYSSFHLGFSTSLVLISKKKKHPTVFFFHFSLDFKLLELIRHDNNHFTILTYMFLSLPSYFVTYHFSFQGYPSLAIALISFAILS